MLVCKELGLVFPYPQLVDLSGLNRVSISGGCRLVGFWAVLVFRLATHCEAHPLRVFNVLIAISILIFIIILNSYRCSIQSYYMNKKVVFWEVFLGGTG